MTINVAGVDDHMCERGEELDRLVGGWYSKMERKDLEWLHTRQGVVFASFDVMEAGGPPSCMLSATEPRNLVTLIKRVLDPYFHVSETQERELRRWGDDVHACTRPGGPLVWVSLHDAARRTLLTLRLHSWQQRMREQPMLLLRRMWIKGLYRSDEIWHEKDQPGIVELPTDWTYLLANPCVRCKDRDGKPRWCEYAHGEVMLR